MASLYARKNKSGTETYRVLIRRKGVPLLCLAFLTREEAQEWIETHEYQYVRNPDEYQKWIEKERINLQRKREFMRRGIIPS